MSRYFRHYNQQRVGGGGGNFFKCKEGENRIRVFPFTHTVQQGDFNIGRYLPGEVEVGAEVVELFVPSRKHFKPTVHTCGLMKTADGRWLGSCETCDNVRTMLNSPSQEDKSSARYMKARHSYAMWVMDMDNREQGLQLYECTQTVLDQICACTESSRNQGKILFGEEGRNFCIVFQKTGPDGKKMSPGNMYRVIMEDKEDSEVLPAQTVEDLYLRPDFVAPEFQSYIVPQEQEDEAPEPKKATKKKRTRKKKEEQEPPAAPAPDPDPEPEIGAKVRFDLDGEEVIGEIKGAYDEDEGGWLVLSADGEGFRVDNGEFEVVL